MEDMKQIIQKLIDSRQAAGLTLEDIHQETHISMRQLSLLEAARIEEIGPPVYVRGFIRRYARAVGLDADLFFEPLPQGSEVMPSGTPTRFAAPRRDLRPLLGFIAVVVVLALAGFLMRDALAGFFQPTPDLPSPLPVEDNDSVDSGEEEPTEEPEPEEPETEVILVEQEGRVLHYVVKHAESIEVRVVFSGEVWYRPVVDGDQLRGASAKDGDELEWTAEFSLELLLGNASETIIYINGKEIIGSELSLPGNSVEFSITLEHEDDDE